MSGQLLPLLLLSCCVGDGGTAAATPLLLPKLFDDTEGEHRISSCIALHAGAAVTPSLLLVVVVLMSVGGSSRGHKTAQRLLA